MLQQVAIECNHEPSECKLHLQVFPEDRYRQLDWQLAEFVSGSSLFSPEKGSVIYLASISGRMPVEGLKDEVMYNINGLNMWCG